VKSFSESENTEMQWVQPEALSRYHELRSGQDVYATLRWVQVFGSLAESASAEGEFTLKRGGFLKRHVTMRDAQTGNDLAVLHIGMFRQGTLEFMNGRRIDLISTRFWSFQWDFVDENGMTLCTVRMVPTLGKRSGEVIISNLVRRDRDLLVMLIAGWYSMVVIRQEAAAASS